MAPADGAQRVPTASTGRLPPRRYDLDANRWAVKLNFMSGITLIPWLKLLWRDARHVDWLLYPHRILFLTFMAVLNSVLALADRLRFTSAVAAQPLHPEPLFILGHPRTGTTHLHNLLSRDPTFAFATTFDAGFPSSFLSLRPLRWMLSGLLAARRPMDEMALYWDLPGEDEIAANVLSGGASPYLALVLPRLWRPRLRAYATFYADSEGGSGAKGGDEGGRPPVCGTGGGTDGAAGAAPSSSGRSGDAGGAARGSSRSGQRGGGLLTEASGGSGGGSELPPDGAAFAAWHAAFMWFMKKVTLAHARDTARRRRAGAAVRDAAASAGGGGGVPEVGAPAPLLIKSPVHLGRVRTWLAMFPRARFVYVHRHPCEVFQSAANMAQKYYCFTYLQRPTHDDLNDFIMDQYDVLIGAYMADRHLIPRDRLVEVSFAELDADPLATLRRVYAALGWESRFEALRPRFEDYVESVADFRKNHFQGLTPEEEAIVRERWAYSFEPFGYT